MRYRVRLSAIEWDDGKGEYDVSEAPASMTIEVEADDPQEAIEYAMSEADEQVGCLIQGARALATEV